MSKSKWSRLLILTQLYVAQPAFASNSFLDNCVQAVNATLQLRKKAEDPSSQEFKSINGYAAAGIIISGNYTLSESLGSLIARTKADLARASTDGTPHKEVSRMAKKLKVLERVAGLFKSKDATTLSTVLSQSIPKDLTVSQFMSMIRSGKLQHVNAEAITALARLTTASSGGQKMLTVYERAIERHAQLSKLQSTRALFVAEANELDELKSFIRRVPGMMTSVPSAGGAATWGRVLVKSAALLGVGGVVVAGYYGAKTLLQDVVVGTMLVDGDFASELMEKPDLVWTKLEGKLITSESICRIAQNRQDFSQHLDQEIGDLVLATGNTTSISKIVTPLGPTGTPPTGSGRGRT